MKKLIAVLALALLPALASAQSAIPHNAELTVTASNPSGACTVGRLWWNTTTSHLWVCEFTAWVDATAAGAVSFPLAAPNGCSTPAYNFGSATAGGSCFDGSNVILQRAEYGVSPTGVVALSATNAAFLYNNGTTDNGFTVSAGSVIGYTSGVLRTTLSTTSFTSTLPHLAPTGCTSPGYSFSADSDAGMCLFGTDILNIFVNPSTAGGNLSLTSTGSSFNFYNGTNNSGLSAASNSVTLQTAGTTRFTLNTTGLTLTLPFLAPDGSASAPSFSFSADPDTGMYRNTTNTLVLASGGTARLTLNTTAFTSTLPFRGPDGSTSAPTYSFSSETNSGIYRLSSGEFAFVIGGSIVWRWTASQQFMQVNGSAATPSLAWVSSTSTGFFNDTGSLGATVGGTERFRAPSAGGLDIADSGSKPTCDSSVRGTFFVDEGGAGVADTVEVCSKDSSDVYAWRTLQ